MWAVHGVYPPKDFPAYVIGSGRKAMAQRYQAARKASVGSAAGLRPGIPGKAAPSNTGMGLPETQEAYKRKQ